jgi:hypothetical protein
MYLFKQKPLTKRDKARIKRVLKANEEAMKLPYPDNMIKWTPMSFLMMDFGMEKTQAFSEEVLKFRSQQHKIEVSAP